MSTEGTDMTRLMYCPCGAPIWVTYRWGDNGYQHPYITNANNDEIDACPSCRQDAATWFEAGDNRLELNGTLQSEDPQPSELIMLPSMTPTAAEKLNTWQIATLADLRANIEYYPKVVAYIAEVSLQRVEDWLKELTETMK
jgi:hypothetical protein